MEEKDSYKANHKKINKIFIEPFIIYNTQYAYLIRVPRSKWKVWIPESICYMYKSAYFDDSFIFYITDGKNKRRCTAQAVIDKFTGITEEHPYIHNKPKEIEPIEAIIPECLKR